MLSWFKFDLMNRNVSLVETWRAVRNLPPQEILVALSACLHRLISSPLRSREVI